MTNEKYLIAFDLDETILNDKKEFPLLTLKGLKRLKKNGHHLLISTGRCLNGTIPFINKLKLYNEYFICNDGTTIYKINEDNQISEKISFKFDNHLINDFFNEIKDILDYAGFSEDEKVYLYHQENTPSEPFAFMNYNTTKIKIDNFDFKNEELTVCSFGITPSGKEKFEKIIADKKYASLNFTAWGEKYGHLNYDVSLKNINKGSAVLKVAAELNIPLDHIITFGDTLNDVSMLKINNQGYILKGNEDIAKKYHLKQTDYSYKRNGVILHLTEHYHFLFD